MLHEGLTEATRRADTLAVLSSGAEQGRCVDLKQPSTVAVIAANQHSSSGRRNSVGLTGQQLRLDSCVRAGDVDRLRTMLRTAVASHMNVNELLMTAIETRQIGCVAQLLEVGADVNAVQVAIGMSPLMISTQLGFIDALPLLLRARADVTLRAGGGETCLHLAVASVSERPSFSGSSDVGLEAAARALALFVDAGADVRSVDSFGRTAAHAAAAASNVPALRVLSEKDAEVLLLMDEHGLTPLHAAASAGALMALEWLLARDLTVAVAARHGGGSVSLLRCQNSSPTFQ